MTNICTFFIEEDLLTELLSLKKVYIEAMIVQIFVYLFLWSKEH